MEIGTIRKIAEALGAEGHVPLEGSTNPSVLAARGYVARAMEPLHICTIIYSRPEGDVVCSIVAPKGGHLLDGEGHTVLAIGDVINGEGKHVVLSIREAAEILSRARGSDGGPRT